MGLRTRPLIACCLLLAVALAWWPGVAAAGPQAAAPRQASDAPRPFLQTLEPHKPIYVLHSWLLHGGGGEFGADDQELLIQFSFRKAFGAHFHFAYTHKALWQVYNEDGSRPIRENDYNPEFFLEYARLWGLDRVRFGLWEHESNGGAPAYDAEGRPINPSRTWNRVYLYMEQGVGRGLTLAAKLWAVTDQKDSPDSSFGEDNPDIQAFLGVGELYATAKGRDGEAALMFRRGWREGTETWRLEASAPLERLFGGPPRPYRLFFQAFSGFGDSLVDYNRRVTRLSLGIAFS